MSTTEDVQMVDVKPETGPEGDAQANSNPSDGPVCERLEFGVESWSSHSANYHPRNVLVNKPNDQSSRWSSGSNNQVQFLQLKLTKPAIIQTITFGKYHKVHVCNLKEFKVFGGMNPDNMLELLHSGLRNDDEPETFALKTRVKGVPYPCQYINVAPLAAWGANFNFSIWYIELAGDPRQEVVRSTLQEYTQFRENEAVRLCLKHFRQRNMMGPFRALQEMTNVQLEHPDISALHEALVINGSFDETEKLLEKAAQDNLFDEYISNCDYRPQWERLDKVDAWMPGMRGGHQMCMDMEARVIYLFGGWDGEKDLDDFWIYYINENRWDLLAAHTSEEGGPGPRSCHKICFDQEHQKLYTLGRYVDPDSRDGSRLNGDFYVYDIKEKSWSLISENTIRDNGPELVYDHQMCIDSSAEVIYVFGGRTITATNFDNTYSGLYQFDIRKNEWKMLRSDRTQAPNSVQLKSRIGHSMLFHSKNRCLYIFAGQRNKDYLSDFYVYDIDSDTVIEKSRDSSKQGGPDAGFTQRATIDPERNELYVLSGLMREKNSSTETMKNSFWVYNISADKWSRVYQNENIGQEYWNKMQDVEPCPRFAHQLVYDTETRLHYLYGGNPGETATPKERLSDCWRLALRRPTPDYVLQSTKFLIRKQQFLEMCQGESTMNALQFLQSKLAEVVDHNDEAKSGEFRNLATALFHADAAIDAPASSVDLKFGVGSLKSGDAELDLYKQRTILYETLLGYFPQSMAQPSGILIDLLGASC